MGREKRCENSDRSIMTKTKPYIKMVQPMLKIIFIALRICTLLALFSIAGCISKIDDMPFINQYDIKGSAPFYLIYYLSSSPEINVVQGVSNIPSGTGVYDFNNIKIGNASGETTFTIENTGTADLIIQSIESDNPRFNLNTANLPVTIPADGKVNFTVTFRPDSIGMQNATITIGNNDNNEGAYTFTVQGYGSNLNIVELEPASNIANGYGSFGNPARKLVDSNGYDLVYLYGDRINDPSGTDIYDDKTGGIFEMERYLRIIVDGKNITEVPGAGGLGLLVRSMNLSNPVSPPGGEVYIDPASGQFALPRPVYWSRCEDSYAGLSNPVIGESKLVVERAGDFWSSPSAGFFNNGVVVASYWPNPNQYSYIWIKPYGSGGYSTKGTASFWAQRIWGGSPGGTSFVTIQFFIGNILISIDKSVVLGEELRIERKVNDSLVPIDKWTGLNWSTFTHIYIVWDNNGGLNSSTKTIRIYIDGTERLSTNETLDFTSVWSTPYGTSVKFNALCNTYGGDIRVYLDNVKFWNHVVSEDPYWEYNAGAGREDALHCIYGPANGYRPGNSQVGYYYLDD